MLLKYFFLQLLPSRGFFLEHIADSGQNVNVLIVLETNLTIELLNIVGTVGILTDIEITLISLAVALMSLFSPLIVKLCLLHVSLLQLLNMKV
jgi:hypothetical protein